MLTEPHLYRRAKEDARYIAELATKLEFLGNLLEQDVPKEGKIRADYELHRKREIKNTLTNIYLVLDLHEVEGIADHVYNADFKKKE